MVNVLEVPMNAMLVHPSRLPQWYQDSVYIVQQATARCRGHTGTILDIVLIWTQE